MYARNSLDFAAGSPRKSSLYTSSLNRSMSSHLPSSHSPWETPPAPRSKLDVVADEIEFLSPQKAN